MPRATFPQNWDLQLSAVLQQKIGAIAREKLKTAVTPAIADYDRLMLIAERFLQLYRRNLHESSVMANLNIPSTYYPGPLEGYPTLAEALGRPLLGAIGIPRASQGNQHALIELIKLGIYAEISFFTTATGGTKGYLKFDFKEFGDDNLAKYNDGRTNVSWVRLIEYGFDVPGYLYLPSASRNLGRSGYGIMQESSRYNFSFAPTHIFQDVFNITKLMLTPEERLLLAIEFVE